MKERSVVCNIHNVIHFGIDRYSNISKAPSPNIWQHPSFTTRVQKSD